MKFINKYYANQAKLINEYTNTKRKLHKTIANIHFNKTCKSKHLIPKYINIKTNSKTKSALNTLKTAQGIWINKEIQFLHKKKAYLNNRLYQLHLEASKLFKHEWPIINNNIEIKIQYEMVKKYATINKKISDLENTPQINGRKPENPKYTQHTQTFHPRVTNLTNLEINNEEKEILELGYKHNFITNTTQQIKSLIIECETAISNIEPTAQNLIREQLADNINRAYKNINEKTQNDSKNKLKIVKQLNNKLLANNITNVKADKGNSIVLINTNEYIEKTKNFFNDNNITELEKDPTERYQNAIKKSLKETDLIFNDNDRKSVINMKPKPPTLKSLIKIHKIDKPIRPIVNFKNAPTYKIAKKLATLLNHKLELQNTYTIKNNIDLVSKIKNLKIHNNETLISLDIKNLYTNIPIKETIDIIKHILSINGDSENVIKQISKLLENILKQNYFKFNNKIYQQKEGLAMGSPLSGILSETFLQHIEQEYIKNIINKYNIKFYTRFVDDILVICDKDKIQNITSEFNNIHKKLNFTLENAINNKINFLDISIQIYKGKLDFSIYRKPTYSDNIIHKNSNHPVNHKRAALNSMIFRLINIPMNKQNYKKELQTILQIAKNNGYPDTTVFNILRRTKAKMKKIQNPITTLKPDEDKNKNKKYIVFTYTDNKIHNILKPLKQRNLTIAYNTNNNIKKLIQNQKNNKDNLLDQNGVYKITCKDCNQVYIGQTGRSFKIRFNEHVKDYQYNRNKSTYANHLLKNNHNIDTIENSLKILHIQNKSTKLNTLETFEIYNHKHNIINENTIDKNALFDLYNNFKTRKKPHTKTQ